jgi:oligopeptide transport system permease protein
VTDTQGAQSIPYYFKPVPVMQRYFNWLARIFTKWDWGVSNNYRVGASAMEIELQGLPYSMKINVVAIFISIPLGLALGVWAALKKNTWVDDTISTIIMIFISVPSFVLISFLLIWFSYNTSWLPARWPSMAEAEASPSWAFKAYIIPVSALSFGTIAGFARYTRAELTEVMSSEFLLLARTKGLTKAQSVVRHALRNSMVPIVPMIIGEFVGILSGSMVLEKLYSIPGVGDLFIKALSGKDYAVLMVDMAVYTLIGLFATLLTDLSYGFVDPRIRMGAVR